MTLLQKIEKDVSLLPQSELAKFRSWFEEFNADKWDKQFEKDVKAGKLDQLADKAISDFRKGNFKKI
jgi:hypothetical protein